MSLTIQSASEADIEAILGLRDGDDLERVKQLVLGAIAAGSCFVARQDDRIVGCMMLELGDNKLGWVFTIFVADEHRRTGMEAKLMRHAQSICLTRTLFTSSDSDDSSNPPMQILLSHLGSVLNGVIAHSDEGRQEIVSCW